MRKSLRDALQPAAREDLARPALGILALIVLLWAAQGAAALMGDAEADWISAIWFASQEGMALWVLSIWAPAAPCVLLPGFALGDVSNPGEDPVVRHGLATGRILALQLPAVLFAVVALVYGATPVSVVRPLFAGAVMTLSAAALAVAVGECHLWDFARRFLLRASGVLLFLAVCFGRRHFGAGPLFTVRLPAQGPGTLGGGPGALVGGGFPFDLAFGAFVAFACTRVIISLRAPCAASPDPPGGGLPAANADAVPSNTGDAELAFPAEEDEGSFPTAIPQAPRDLEPGTGLRAAWGYAYRGRMGLVLLATLPVLGAMIAYAPAAQWLQRVPGGSVLTSLAGYPPAAWNPLTDDWDWQWSQSSGYALLAAVVAWAVLAGRLAIAPLAARATAELRGGSGPQGGVLSGLSPLEALAWASLPPVLPVAALGLVAALLAALPPYRDGVPTQLLVLMVLAGPVQAVFCGMLGAAVGLRARTTKGAAATAGALAGLGLPLAFTLLSLGFSLTTRGLDQADRFIESIGSGYQNAVVLSLLLGAEVAWWVLRRVRATRA